MCVLSHEAGSTLRESRTPALSPVVLLPQAQPASSEVWAWLMPHRVAAWIYWHATLLLWAGVPFLPHPKSSDPAAYKRDILAKAEASGKTLCPAVGAAAVGQPRFSWRDAARYPWDG